MIPIKYMQKIVIDVWQKGSVVESGKSMKMSKSFIQFPMRLDILSIGLMILLLGNYENSIREEEDNFSFDSNIERI